MPNQGNINQNQSAVRKPSEQGNDLLLQLLMENPGLEVSEAKAIRDKLQNNATSQASSRAVPDKNQMNQEQREIRAKNDSPERLDTKEPERVGESQLPLITVLSQNQNQPALPVTLENRFFTPNNGLSYFHASQGDDPSVPALKRSGDAIEVHVPTAEVLQDVMKALNEGGTIEIKLTGITPDGAGNFHIAAALENLKVWGRELSGPQQDVVNAVKERLQDSPSNATADEANNVTQYNDELKINAIGLANDPGKFLVLLEGRETVEGLWGDFSETAMIVASEAATSSSLEEFQQTCFDTLQEPWAELHENPEKLEYIKKYVEDTRKALSEIRSTYFEQSISREDWTPEEHELPSVISIRKYFASEAAKLAKESRNE